MTLNLSRDAAFLNRVVNDPSVFPWVNLGMEGPLDLTAVLEIESTVFLANEHGGFLFVDCGNGVYELHTQFLPEGRGSAVFKLGNEAIKHMFSKTPCVAIRTFVAYGNKRAYRLALAGGFEDVAETDVNGVSGRGLILTIKRWVCQQQH